MGEGLDQQHRAAGRQRLGRMPGGSHRIAQVVQGVEEADEVIAPGVIVGLGQTEVGLTRNACRRCMLPRLLYRGRVRIEAVEARLRECLGHQQR